MNDYLKKMSSPETPPVHLGGRHDGRPGGVHHLRYLHIAVNPEVGHILGPQAVLVGGELDAVHAHLS